MSNHQLLVHLLSQPDLPAREASPRTGPSNSKYVLNLASCTIMSKVQLEQAIDINTNALQKELHDQRLKQLRKLMKDIEDDDWQYEPVEKSIGLR